MAATANPTTTEPPTWQMLKQAGFLLYHIPASTARVYMLRKDGSCWWVGPPRRSGRPPRIVSTATLPD